MNACVNPSSSRCIMNLLHWYKSEQLSSFKLHFKFRWTFPNNTGYKCVSSVYYYTEVVESELS